VPAPLWKVSTAMRGRVTGNSQARVPITAIMIRGLETLRASETCGRIATRWRARKLAYSPREALKMWAMRADTATVDPGGSFETAGRYALSRIASEADDR